jgi:hypothetical protein
MTRCGTANGARGVQARSPERTGQAAAALYPGPSTSGASAWFRRMDRVRRMNMSRICRVSRMRRKNGVAHLHATQIKWPVLLIAREAPASSPSVWRRTPSPKSAFGGRSSISFGSKRLRQNPVKAAMEGARPPWNAPVRVCQSRWLGTESSRAEFLCRSLPDHRPHARSGDRVIGSLLYRGPGSAQELSQHGGRCIIIEIQPHER